VSETSKIAANWIGLYRKIEINFTLPNYSFEE
jgi:hypothetical protein